MLRDFPLSGAALAAMAGGPKPGSAVPADVPIRHAATVMLVRAGASPSAAVEVFTIARPPTMVFAAGMVVFPGGGVDPRDGDPGMPWAGPPPSRVAAAMSAPLELGRAVLAAAVRETFEECGVLLAGVPHGPVVTGPLDDATWDARRQQLIAGTIGLADLLRDAGLELRADLLRPWAHWVTPPGEVRRFDTRFFVALLPDGQQARHLAGEAETASWVAPRRLLEDWSAGRVPMLPPTVVAMEELAAAGSVEELMTARRVLRPVSPWLVTLPADGDDGPRAALRVDLDGIGGGEPGPGQQR
jgi:8-oxo-dGTP pyrophosphatase MutT (NUDIX family)